MNMMSCTEKSGFDRTVTKTARKYTRRWLKELAYEAGFGWCLVGKMTKVQLIQLLSRAGCPL